VDWLVEAGNPINRICDHDKWISQFESALRNLPENLRQHSVLGVLDAFRRPMEPEAGSAVPCSRYRQATEDMHFAIPHLSASLIHRYSSGLHALKLV
jgi:fatty acid CoA ligase FadD9